MIENGKITIPQMPKSHLVGCCPLQAKVPDKQTTTPENQ